MEIEINIRRGSIEKLTDLSTRLFRMAGVDLRVPLSSIGEYMLTQFGDRIKGEYGFGKRWAQLRPSTIIQRRREGYGAEHPILQRKGSLFNAATRRGWSGTSYKRTPIKNIWRIPSSGSFTNASGGVSRSNFTLQVGVESDYIERLHNGGVKIKGRDFIYVTNQNRAEAKRIVKNWVTSRLTGLSNRGLI